MPLDGHSYLVAQGWTGKGTGLRHGAIIRPLAIPQKKSLAGLGKDRDEAFPFWDHLFSAAAKSIQLKITSDDSESDAESSTPAIKRTTTGILSNRRPIMGVSATTSGTSTPDAGNQISSLLSTAKREAAKSVLYARFFRGPVLGPDGDDGKSKHTTAVIITEAAQVQMSALEVGVGSSKKSGKRRKSDDGDESERRERNSLKKVLKKKSREADGGDVQDITKSEEDLKKQARKERKRRKRERRQKDCAVKGSTEKESTKKRSKHRLKESPSEVDESQDLPDTFKVDALAGIQDLSSGAKKRCLSDPDDSIAGLDDPGRSKDKKRKRKD